MVRCLGCMEEYAGGGTCPHCGYQEGTGVKESYYLMPGTLLRDQYLVGKVLGYGGFGVTYLGWDNSLSRKIAIKEYMPSDCATRIMGQTEVEVHSGETALQYEAGLKSFIEEARRLAKFNSVPEIVDIYDSFQENNTGYIIMEYLEGQDLGKIISKGRKMEYQDAVEIIKVVLSCLIPVHKEGIIHRDIAPDNIFILKDKSIKLTDFGAARYTSTHSKSLSIVLKQGYAPEEQYRSKGDQGPWTDVYAAGATLYRMITGVKPQNSIDRLRDDRLRSPRQLDVDIPESLNTAIMNALNVKAKDRFQTAQQFLNALQSDKVERIEVSEEKPKNKKLGWALPAAACLFMGAAIVCAVVMKGAGAEQPDWMEERQEPLAEGQSYLPDLTGMSYEDAKKQIEADGCSLVIGGKNYSATVAYDKILSQEPAPGTVVSAGQEVQLVMSGGLQEVTMPDLESVEEEQALKLIEGQGLVLAGEAGHEYNDLMQKGRVFWQSVSAGEKLAPGNSVQIKVSLGKLEEETAVLTVPELAGKTKEEADDILLAMKNEKGFTFSYGQITRENSTEIPEGTIISQGLTAGEEKRTSEVIDIVISDGPKKVEMPDVVYLAQAEAKEKIETAGLKMKVTRQYSDSVKKGNVISQTVKAGDQVAEGSEVEIVVSDGTKPAGGSGGQSSSGGSPAADPQPGQTQTQPGQTQPQQPAGGGDDWNFSSGGGGGGAGDWSFD